MIAIRKCEEHNDQNPDCPVCYPPINLGTEELPSVRISKTPLKNDTPIDAEAHKRIDALLDAVEHQRQVNEKQCTINEMLIDSVESLREAITKSV